MKTLKPFKYLAPETLAEATSLLNEHGEEARVLAGGTDLVPLMKDRVIAPKYLIDIKRLKSMDYIKWDEKEGLRIGALTIISAIARSQVIKEKYLCLQQAAESLGAVQVRNMATLGGDVCRSSPSADMVPPLLVLGAEVKLVGSRGERIIPMGEFIIGPGQNVLNNEILTEIKIPAQEKSYSSVFGKVGRVSEDLAKVNCAVKVTVVEGRCEDIKIALGAVAPTAVRAKKVEEAIKGEELSVRNIATAASLVGEDCCPITDVRSDIDYRRHLSKILVERLINEAVRPMGASKWTIS